MSSEKINTAPGEKVEPAGREQIERARREQIERPHLEEKSDEEVMNLYAQGHEAAFKIIYKRYSGKVYGFLSKRLEDQDFANDLFQQTWMKFHRTRTKYNSSYPLAPWLFTICRSVLVDGLRQKKRIQETPDSELLEIVASSAPEVPPENPAPDLDHLPAAQRMAVKLRYHEDLSFEEIAAHLKTSPVNARQIISRAIRKLKSLGYGSEGEA